MMYLDLSELPELLDPFWGWSSRRFAMAWFRDEDHYHDPDRTLIQGIRRLVSQRIGLQTEGPITLLTHFRYFGVIMNPVSFYYCWDKSVTHIECIVAEVNNTPWGERYCYVLRCSPGSENSGMTFDFDKNFHVSPFMSMNQRYFWEFGFPGDQLDVVMETRVDQKRVFRASLELSAMALNQRNLSRCLASYPFMTSNVVFAIYIQALRLWSKKIPFYPHPDRHRTEPAQT